MVLGTESKSLVVQFNIVLCVMVGSTRLMFCKRTVNVCKQLIVIADQCTALPF